MVFAILGVTASIGETGRVYIADTGETLREEIDVTSISAGGQNFGWPYLEGSLCFPSNPCDVALTGLSVTAPILEYDHSQGCSITGGTVYRGNAIADLRGRYFYSDYCSGFLKSFVYSGTTLTENLTWNISSVGGIVSFGEDSAGELYMLAANNQVYRIVRQ